MDRTQRPPREDLFRAQPVIELTRSGSDNGMPTLTGHFAVFGQWAHIRSVWEGEFMERFAPGSFSKTIKESKDSMRVLFQHGKDPQIGERVLGPIESLSEDQQGVHYSVPLLETAYNRDLVPGLEKGLYGASFRFSVVKEEFDQSAKRSSHNPDGLPERTVTEAKVMEFGPVTFPAYSGATAGLRSISDDILIGRFLDDPERLLEMIEQYKNRAESEPAEATTQPDEKPEPVRVTTPRATSTTLGRRVALYSSTRKEKPSWLL